MSNLVRYEPTVQLQRMENDFDRLFTDNWWPARSQRLFDDEFFSWPAPMNLGMNMVVGDNLSVDMYETADEVVVKADLPDVRPEDVEVEERDGWLTIRANSQQESERNQRGWQIRERRYGAWQRTLRLPVSVHGDQADANFDGGILTVKLPKVDAGKPLFNRIPVKWPKLKLPKFGKKEKKVKVSHG